MNTNKHTLHVIFKAKEGKENELKSSLLKLVNDTLKEEGCLNYDLHASPTNIGQFMIYENWVNKNAHTMHDKSAHVLNWRQQKHNFVDSTEVSIWEHIS
jgi:quinol monooxygenase YgiN